MEHHKNLNLKFIKISSTPWHGSADHDWKSKSCALKHQPTTSLMHVLLQVWPRHMRGTHGGHLRNALKGIQVTHGTSQKFEFEIHQNLIHTLAWFCGS